MRAVPSYVSVTVCMCVTVMSELAVTSEVKYASACEACTGAAVSSMLTTASEDAILWRLRGRGKEGTVESSTSSLCDRRGGELPWAA